MAERVAADRRLAVGGAGAVLSASGTARRLSWVAQNLRRATAARREKSAIRNGAAVHDIGRTADEGFGLAVRSVVAMDLVAIRGARSADGRDAMCTASVGNAAELASCGATGVAALNSMRRASIGASVDPAVDR